MCKQFRDKTRDSLTDRLPSTSCSMSPSKKSKDSALIENGKTYKNKAKLNNNGSNMKPVLSETVGAQRAICFKGRTEEEIACRFLPQKMCFP